MSTAWTHDPAPFPSFHPPPPAPRERAAGLAVLATAVTGLGMTLASSRTQVFVAGWAHGRATRTAFLPAPAWLALSAGLAVVILAVTTAWWTRRRGSVSELARWCAPLAWLNVLALPFVPVLADLVPGLTLLAGPFRWALVVAVATATIWPLARDRVSARLQAVNPRPLLLFVVAFTIYASLGIRTTRVQGLGGDEPHYLVITESLLRDGDLQIENNHANRDYARFFPLDLAPHFIQRGVGGVIYSIHAPGLPALVLPAYAVAGRTGVNLFMGVLAALAGLAVFRLARALTTPPLALITWAGVTLSTPFVMHGWLIYPEMPAACVAAWALWWIYDRPPLPTWAWCGRGLIIGYLPWLHVKFAVLLAGLAIGLVWRLVKRPRALVAFTLPIVVSLAAWFYAFQVMYGVPDPTMPYGGRAALGPALAWANVPRGLLGLLFDQEFGLLPYSPIFIVAGVGLVALRRVSKATPALATSALTTVAFLVSTTRYYMWWGGWSVPARFALPVLPLLAPFVACGASRLTSRAAGRALLTVMLAASLVATILLLAQPDRMLMFNDRDGTSKLLEWLEGPSSLTMVFPSFLWPDWRVQLPRVAVLVAGLLLGVLAVQAAGHRVSGPRAEVHLALLFIVATVVGVETLARLTMSRGMAAELVRSGQLAMLDRWDPEHAVDLSRFSRLTARELLDRVRLPLYTGTGEAPDEPQQWLGPWHLPAGRYVARIWLQPGPREPGEFLASFRGTAAVAARADAAVDQPVTLHIELPEAIDLPPLWLGASTRTLTARVMRVDLTAESVPRHGAREPEPIRALENVAGSPGAYIVYLDGDAFPEGGVFWTRGQTETHLFLTTGGAGSLRLETETGAAPGRATIAFDGVPTVLDLPAHVRRTLNVRVPPGHRGVWMRVKFTGGFRPSEVDATRDTRWLGLRVRPFVP